MFDLNGVTNTDTLTSHQCMHIKFIDFVGGGFGNHQRYCTNWPEVVTVTKKIIILL